jgi:hypothetical protein
VSMGRVSTTGVYGRRTLENQGYPSIRRMKIVIFRI